MAERSDGSSSIKKGRRGKKMRGDNKGLLANKSNSNDGPQKQQQRFPVVADPRFASMHNAPTFQRSKPDDRKVQLDDRFKAVLTDPRFRVSDAKVDKYGRRVKKASRGAETELRAFYKVEEKDGHKKIDDDDEEENDNQEKEDFVEPEEGEMGKGFEVDGGVMTAEEDSRQVYLTKLSRGEISVSSSDDSSASSDDEERDGAADSDDDYDAGVNGSSSHERGREAADVPMLSEESSRRLAVTNCDWDHLRARDLMVLCGSFCPSSARLSSVRVYPSDFGLEMMELETTAGPHAVLARGKGVVSTNEGDTDEADSSMDKDELEDDHQVVGDDDDGEDNQEGSEGTSAGDVESETEAEGRDGVGVSTSAGVAVAGRVVRRRRPGVIIEEYRGATVSSEDEEDGEGSAPSSKNIFKKEKRSKELEGVGGGGDGKGFDAEKLRAYELRKLKYYFAVLEFSSVAAAEAVYKEVDGMEFEHSAVALDLRFVPDDVSFDGRTVRDSCTSVPSSYQPPTFICKALQQTRVECTWDEVPAERQVLLGRTSQWRDAAEEDFEAYLATSSDESEDSSNFSDADSDHSGDDEGGDNAAGGIQKKERKEKKLLSAAAARRARKVLLEDALGSDAGTSGSDAGTSGSDEEESEGDYEDDAAAAAAATEAFSPRGDAAADDDDEAEAGNAEFTFVPRGKKAGGQGGGGMESLLARKKQRDALAKETPWEASLRKERERKKARKRALKEKIQEDDGGGLGGAQGQDGFFLEEVLPGGDAGNGTKPRGGGDKEDSDPEDEFGVWNSSDQEDEKEEERRDYDMHRLAREEKLKGKKLRGKRKRKEMAREKAPGQDFTVDVKDDRFAAVLEGDTRFGIDRTDASFKRRCQPTPTHGGLRKATGFEYFESAVTKYLPRRKPDMYSLRWRR